MPITSFAKPINRFSTSVFQNHIAGDGVLVVASAAGLTLNAGEWIRATIVNQGVLHTILKVSAVSGNILTVAGGVDGYSDDAIEAGEFVELLITAGDFSDLYTAVNTLEAGSGQQGLGTVTSVGLTVPAEFSVAGSPVQTSGTLAISKATETANTVWAGPTSGGAAVPTFRALVASDIPSITESQVTNLTTDLAAKAPLAAPAFTGSPTGDASLMTVLATGSSTARSLAARFTNQVFNVLDWGVTGLGVVDDQPAIMALLRYVSNLTTTSGGRRVIYFPAGTYAIGSATNNQGIMVGKRYHLKADNSAWPAATQWPGITFLGDGYSTTLKSNAPGGITELVRFEDCAAQVMEGFRLVATVGCPITLAALHITAVGSGEMHRTQDVVVEGQRFQGGSCPVGIGCGLDYPNDTAQVHFFNCKVRDCTYAGWMFGTGLVGNVLDIRMWGCQSVSNRIGVFGNAVPIVWYGGIASVNQIVDFYMSGPSGGPTVINGVRSELSNKILWMGGGGTSRAPITLSDTIIASWDGVTWTTSNIGVQPFYTQSVTVTNGQTSVTGVGTFWSSHSQVIVGQVLVFQNDPTHSYTVASIQSDTALTLGTAFQGSSGSTFANVANSVFTMTTTNTGSPATTGQLVNLTVGSTTVTSSVNWTAGLSSNSYLTFSNDSYELIYRVASVTNATTLVLDTTSPYTAFKIPYTMTVTVTNGSPTVTGTGTAFTHQVSVGTVVTFASDGTQTTYTIQSIESDTSLTLTGNYAAANSGTTMTIVSGSFNVKCPTVEAFGIVGRIGGQINLSNVTFSHSPRPYTYARMNIAASNAYVTCMNVNLGASGGGAGSTRTACFFGGDGHTVNPTKFTVLPGNSTTSTDAAAVSPLGLLCDDQAHFNDLFGINYYDNFTAQYQQLGGGMYVQEIANPTAAITLNGHVGTNDAAGNYYYWYVCKDLMGNRTLVTTTGSGLITGNSTLSTSNYTKINVPQVAGTVYIDILRNTTNDVNTAASIVISWNPFASSPNFVYSDQSMTTAAYTLPTRNATGDMKCDGSLTSATVATGALTGTPTAPTPATNDNSTKIATTAYVQAQGYTAAPFAESQVTGLVTDLAAKAPLNSPSLTGTPLSVTPATGDNSTAIATTAYVKNQAYATLASPTFTGTPAAPTPSNADNSTKIATTAYVLSTRPEQLAVPLAALNMNSQLISSLGTPSAATDATTKGYVDGLVSGAAQKLTANVVAVSPLPANTYNNGTAGVGATLTGNSVGVLTIDSVAVALDDDVLIAGEATAAHNGYYKCTTAGAGGVAYVLTRDTTMDQPSEFAGSMIAVNNGTVYSASLWYESTTIVTVGTTPVNFIQLNKATVYTAGTGISIIANAISVASTYAGGTSIATLGTVTAGTWNATAIAIANGGTGQTTAGAAFDALSPMTTLGDIAYYSAGSPHVTRLAGNTTTTRNFLRQVGTGSASAAPAWDTIAVGDLPTVDIAHGGTGQTTAALAFDALGGTTTTGDMVWRASGGATRFGGNATTTNKFLTQSGNGATANVPAWNTIAAADLPTVTIAKGGTGGTTQAAGFDGLSPMTLLGDIIYGGASGTGTALAGNTTNVKQFLNQTGSGSPGFTSNAPQWSAIGAGDLPNIPISGGGTGQITASAAFNALSPTSLLGDILYCSVSGTPSTVAALPGNTTAAIQFLTQTGTGTVSAAPAWHTLVAADLPTITIAKGGTGAITKAAGFDALSPMTTLGDLIYGGASGTGTALAGDTSNTKKFLTTTSSGGVATAPSWGTIAATDVPAAGSTTQIEYNSSGVRSGSANLTFDGTNVLVGSSTVPGNVLVGMMAAPAVAVIYTATGPASVSTNTTGTLIGSGVGSLTLPANFLTVGKSILIRADGYITTASSSASSLVFQVKLGSSIIARTNNGTGLTPALSLTGRYWALDFIFTCRTTGTTGTIWPMGEIWMATSNSSAFTNSSGTGVQVCNGTTPSIFTFTTPGTTGTQVVDFQVIQSTNTAGTIVCSNFIMMALN